MFEIIIEQFALLEWSNKLERMSQYDTFLQYDICNSQP